jgi:MinD-like ATPase involved in chromosome partitioning or flagellar assembly
MKTITFYSYKGGVGRTLTLVNFVQYLSRLGFNTCVMDFDLEAPGFNSKFEKYFQTKINKGLVDYIHDFYYQDETIGINEISYLLDLKSEFNETGKIMVIPAGNIYNPIFYKKLSKINWHEILYDAKNNGALFFMLLKEKIKAELNPDFLIIDSRTGITEIGGVCTSILADQIVYLTSNNTEGFRGVKTIYEITKQNNKDAEVLFCISRIPMPFYDIDSYEASIDLFFEIINENEKIINEVDDINIIHSCPSMELNEDTIAGAKRIPEELMQLNSDYLKLFSTILSNIDVGQRINRILEDIFYDIRNDPEVAGAKLKAIVEQYPLKSTYEALIDYYRLSKADLVSILEAYDELWNITEDISIKHLNEYIRDFREYEKHFYFENFNPEIVDSYLEKNRYHESYFVNLLAKLYYKRKELDEAEALFIRNLANKEYEENTLFYLFKIYGQMRDSEKGQRLFLNYKSDVLYSLRLKRIYADFLLNTREYEDLKYLLAEDFNIEILYYLLNTNKKLFLIFIEEKMNWPDFKYKLIIASEKFILDSKLNQSAVDKATSIFLALELKQELYELSKKYELEIGYIKSQRRLGKESFLVDDFFD